MSAAAVDEAAYVPRASVAECRVRERHPCGLQTSCQPIAARSDKDCLWPAEVRDISLNGLGLVLRRRFERGAGLAVEVRGTDGELVDTLLVKVIHVSPRQDGSYLLGCAFASELSEDELGRLLALAKAQQAEAEEADIFSSQPASRVEKLAEASGSMVVPRVRLAGPGRQGVEVSRAVRRFFLKGSWPLLAGTVLRLRIFKKNGDESPPATIRVIRCAKGEKGWTINYCFVGSPSPDAMRLLGY
jgi:hypothetical protein